MFIIDEGTEAFEVLRRMVESSDTYKISIAVRDDSQITLKQNEGMWTPPLQVRAQRHDLEAPPLPVNVAFVAADRGWDGDR